MHQHRRAILSLALAIPILAALACSTATLPIQLPPLPITQVVQATQIVPVTRVVPVTQVPPLTQAVPPAPGASLKPDIVLTRLIVTYYGQDGHKVIGSGCPGTDGKGAIVDNHLMVSNVDQAKKVKWIGVAGDNSTLTWEWPCSRAWALSATDLGNGVWDVFIAPSEPTQVYTVMVFYEDNSFAVGMTVVR
jgi:hypothetical protein